MLDDRYLAVSVDMPLPEMNSDNATRKKATSRHKQALPVERSKLNSYEKTEQTTGARFTALARLFLVNQLERVA
jgi:hypothetical protein